MTDKDNHTVRKLAIGSLLAGAVGYVTGILTAPKSGKETRHDIADKAVDIKDSAEAQLEELNEELHDLVKKTKQKTVALSASARAEFNEAVIRAKDAQNKTGQMLKAVKSGEASDPDLNKAIKQAKLAVKNLSKYYKNQ
jgi:gas vesicle protein